MSAWVYIMASRRNGTLYIGVTSRLSARIGHHKGEMAASFTARYKVRRLVYCEEHARIIDARMRERQLKRWRRSWKIALIEATNPYWRDLAPDLSHHH